MCIAILNKSGQLAEEIFENSFENNPDGCGMAWIEKGQIQTLHNLKSWKPLYEKYLKIRPATADPILIHFRIGTSGKKDERNLHPFTIGKDLAMIHNGILTYHPTNPDYSDTWHFAQMLKSLRDPAKLIESESLEFKQLESFIGSSKICYLHKSGKVSIMNEKAGHWNGESWFSNTTYEQCSYYPIGYSKSYGNDDWPPLSMGYSFADLQDWPNKMLDEEELSGMWYHPEEFEAMTYPDQTMINLSLGSLLYDIKTDLTTVKAIDALQTVSGVKTQAELYQSLYDQLYNLKDEV